MAKKRTQQNKKPYSPRRSPSNSTPPPRDSNPCSELLTKLAEQARHSAVSHPDSSSSGAGPSDMDPGHSSSNDDVNDVATVATPADVGEPSQSKSEKAAVKQENKPSEAGSSKEHKADAPPFDCVPGPSKIKQEGAEKSPFPRPPRVRAKLFYRRPASADQPSKAVPKEHESNLPKHDGVAASPKRTEGDSKRYNLAQPPNARSRPMNKRTTSTASQTSQVLTAVGDTRTAREDTDVKPGPSKTSNNSRKNSFVRPPRLLAPKYNLLRRNSPPTACQPDSGTAEPIPGPSTAPEEPGTVSLPRPPRSKVKPFRPNTSPELLEIASPGPSEVVPGPSTSGVVSPDTKSIVGPSLPSHIQPRDSSLAEHSSQLPTIPEEANSEDGSSSVVPAVAANPIPPDAVANIWRPQVDPPYGCHHASADRHQLSLTENGPYGAIHYGGPSSPDTPLQVDIPGPPSFPPGAELRFSPMQISALLSFYRVRLGPLPMLLVCPFCAQLVTTVTVLRVDNYLWSHSGMNCSGGFVYNRSQFSGCHVRQLVCDTDHHCPNCLGHIGTYSYRDQIQRVYGRQITD